jgi:hypothetical protein
LACRIILAVIRLPRAPLALAFALVLAGACGGSTGNDAKPSTPPIDPNDGGTSGGPTSLPCDVDEVLAKNCRLCHSSPPAYGAPMSLMTWNDLHANAAGPGGESKKTYDLVAEKIADDIVPMPPPPNARLTAAARKVITDWVAAGAPKGPDTCESTSIPKPTDISCTPKLTLEASAPWEMSGKPGEGDEYVCWGVDLTKPDPTHITAFSPRIDNKKIVHHVVVYEAPSSYDTKPKRCNASAALSWRMVLGWAPGVKGLELPPEAGFPIATTGATHYVVQMHYSNPSGAKGEKDSSKIDLCTAPPRKYEADVMAFGSQNFDIPPNPPGGIFEHECKLTVPSQFAGLHFFAAMPHMHKLGATMKTELTRKSGGAKIDMGTMSSYSFDSQAWVPVNVTSASGDVITTTCGWRNNTGAVVSFGENTAEEMCYSFTMYYPRVSSPIWSWALPASGPPLGATCVDK